MPEPSPQVAPPHAPRMTGQQRRESILEAAGQEFARIGYHGASTAGIARAAGCSEPMLYKHFSGKEDLFVAALDRACAAIDESLDALVSAPGILVDLLTDALPVVFADPRYVAMVRLRTLAQSIVHVVPVAERLRQQQDALDDRIRRAVDRGRAEGSLRSDIEAEHVAWMWTGLVLAGSFREALQPGGLRDMIPTVLWFLDGLRA